MTGLEWFLLALGGSTMGASLWMRGIEDRSLAEARLRRRQKRS